MTFSERVKNEILKTPLKEPCCRLAALSAFIRGAGTIAVRSGILGFEVVTENRAACEYFPDIIRELYGETAEITETGDKLKNRKKYMLSLISEKSFGILKELGIVFLSDGAPAINLGIDKYLIENECCKKAYIIGAFIGSGSVTVPKKDGRSQTGYHLEFVFSKYQTAEDFTDLLCETGFMPRLIERKESFVIYFKTSDEICDLLAFMNARNCYFSLNELIIEKDLRNDTNRRINCEMANIEKQVEASIGRINAISVIEETIGLDELSAPLRAVAIARMNNPDASMSELASIAGITKSCLNHRLRKLSEIAENLSK